MDLLNRINLNFFHALTRPQKVYFIAFVLQFTLIFSTDLINYTTIGFIAIVGMAMELWPKFVAAWNNLLGRFIIIISYAIVANFAVAFAAQKLNQIIGVDPTPLFYSIGFATLMMAPIWMLTLSALVMVGYTVLLQAIVLLKITLKLLRIEKYLQTSPQKNGLSLALLKLVLIPAMFTSLVASIDYYGGADGNPTKLAADAEDEDQTNYKRFNFNLSDIATNNLVNDENDLNQQERVVNESSSTTEGAKNINTEIETMDSANSVAEQKVSAEGMALEQQISDETTDLTFNHMIAVFVYNVELFQFSQCIKTHKEKVLFMGEFDILVGVPDKSAKYGYRFSVRNCQLKAY